MDNIIQKIKNEKNNSQYINMIIDYVRGTHTKFVIKKNYEKIKIPFVTFRDFNSNNPDNIVMKEFNQNVLDENKILKKYSNHIISILQNASHTIWSKVKYKNVILNTIKKIKNLILNINTNLQSETLSI